MQNQLLLRARRQRRLIYQLIVRHPIIAQTDVWRRIVRRGIKRTFWEPGAQTLENWGMVAPIEEAGDLEIADTSMVGPTPSIPGPEPLASGELVTPSFRPDTVLPPTPPEQLEVGSEQADPGESSALTFVRVPLSQRIQETGAVGVRPSASPILSDTTAVGNTSPTEEVLNAEAPDDVQPFAHQASTPLTLPTTKVEVEQPAHLPATTPSQVPVSPEPGALFTPSDADRTPDAWAARLFVRQTQPVRPGVEAEHSLPPDVIGYPTPHTQQPDPARPIVSRQDEEAVRPESAATPLEPAEVSRIPPIAEKPTQLPLAPPLQSESTKAQVAQPTIDEMPGQVPAPVTEEETELFTSGASDRTPQAWANRLIGMSKAPAPSVIPSGTSPRTTIDPGYLRETSTPLPERTRRFLQPLVGIDPATVPVFRGAVATQLTSDANADALAVNSSILLGSGADIASPQGLGLIAHELTHIARQRSPRFVPPVVANRTGVWIDEEALTGEVERQTMNVARQVMAPPQEPLVPQGRPLLLAPPVSATAAEPEETTPVVQDSDIDVNWAGLPAPWEPLPEWTTTLPNPMIAPDSQPPPQVYADNTHTFPPTEGSATAGMSSLAVERAARDRDTGSDTPITEPEQASAPAPTNTPDPDLDALARQIYGVLKRRLMAERRRMG